MHAFFAERAVSKVPGVSKDTPTRSFEEVAIIGAGTMGGGISTACANAGLRVTLTDGKEDALEKGRATIRRNYEASVKRGRLSPEAVEQRIGLIQPQVGFDHLAAGSRDRGRLRKPDAEEAGLYRPRRSHWPDCILATNTSTLDIDEIASATARPESVVGLHFFSPANVMRLLEIVRGKATSASVIASALALAKRLGKVGVVVGNGPGFVGNRMMFPYMTRPSFSRRKERRPSASITCSPTGVWQWGSLPSTTWAASTSRGACVRSCTSSRNPGQESRSWPTSS